MIPRLGVLVVSVLVRIVEKVSAGLHNHKVRFRNTHNLAWNSYPVPLGYKIREVVRNLCITHNLGLNISLEVKQANN